MRATTPAPWSLLRMRQSPHLRDLVAETTFGVKQFVQPVFVVEDLRAPEDVPGLGDTRRLPLASALDAIADDADRGVRHFLLFNVPADKQDDEVGTEHLARTIATIKQAFGARIFLWIDVCLCAYTTHGHCALLDARSAIDLDRTLSSLDRIAVASADAGADGVAPSDMMDGRTRSIRAALDGAGHHAVPIMSYSTKFASSFYGPFRDAAASAPAFGDRRHYQIDVRGRRDAIAASVRCAGEGADLLMVKPGMTSADLIAPITRATKKPVGAYQVSGEYAALFLLAERKLVDFDSALVETWHVLRRAGAAFIISYGARRAASLGLAS